MKFGKDLDFSQQHQEVFRIRHGWMSEYFVQQVVVKWFELW